MGKVGYVFAAVALLFVPPAHADCRTAIGGSYAFAHGGWKLDGNPHSGLAYFAINQNGSFAVSADINEQAANPPYIQEDLSGPWDWPSPNTSNGRCTIHFGYTAQNLPPGACCVSAMYGIVSDDGNTISIATYDKEMMWGTAVRVGQ